MNLSRFIFFLIIALSSVGFATAEGPFLPAQKNEESNTKRSGLSRILTTVGEKFKPGGKPPSSEKRGLRRILSTTLGEATKAKEAGKPPSSGKRGLRLRQILSTTLGEATKAGKAPSSDEGLDLNRKRQHECRSMEPFEDEYLYQSGCNGKPWEVTIKCEKKGRRDERDSGLTCNYYEKTVDEDSGVCPYSGEDSDKCPYSGDFVSKDVLNTDGEGNCELGPFTIYPVAMAGNEDCLQNYPRLDVKIILVGNGELEIYFSNDGGKSYYNQEDPRVALSLSIHGGSDGDDADGMNSGGGSSKGGKGKNHRQLVADTKAQLQRKMTKHCIDCNTVPYVGMECAPIWRGIGGQGADESGYDYWTPCKTGTNQILVCHCPPTKICQCHQVWHGTGDPCGGLNICAGVVEEDQDLFCCNGECKHPECRILGYFCNDYSCPPPSP